MGTSALRIDRLEQNFLINGGWEYWQRVAPTTGTNTGNSLAYSAPDRWRVAHTGTHSFTPNVRRTTVTPGTGGVYSLRHDFQRNASAATFTYEQLVESHNAVMLTRGGVMSCGFQVLCPVSGGTAQLIVSSPTAQDNHASQSVIHTSSSVPLTADAWTELTFDGINTGVQGLGLSVKLVITLPSGSDGAAESLYLADCMANNGPKAASFNRAGFDVGTELMLCQRYYEKSYELETSPGVATAAGCIYGGYTATGSYGTIAFQFKVTKRATPTMAIRDLSGNSAVTAFNAGNGAQTHGVAVSGGQVGQNGYSMNISNGVGVVVWFGAHYTANAEIN